MFAVERQRLLLDELRRTGAVSVVGTSRRLGVSEPTARRDLAALVRAGLADRVHGGAVLPRRATGRVPQTPTARPAPPGALGALAPTGRTGRRLVDGASAVAASVGWELVPTGPAAGAGVGALTDRVAGLLVAAPWPVVRADGAGRPPGGRPGAAGWVLPVVLVGRPGRTAVPGARTVARVEVDVAAGGRLAVRHLREDGARRTGVVVPRTGGDAGALLGGWHDEAAGDLPGGVVERAVVADRQHLEDLLRRCATTGTDGLVVRAGAVPVPLLALLGAAVPVVVVGGEPSGLPCVRPRPEDLGAAAVAALLGVVGAPGAHRPPAPVPVVLVPPRLETTDPAHAVAG